MTDSMTEEGSNEEGKDIEQEGSGVLSEGKVGEESSMAMVGRGEESYEGNVEGCLFLYSVRADFECFKFLSGSQELSSAKNPFHRIRKERLDGGPQWCKIFSISYSSLPLIRSGGGFGKFGLWTGFLP